MACLPATGTSNSPVKYADFRSSGTVESPLRDWLIVYVPVPAGEREIGVSAGLRSVRP